MQTGQSTTFLQDCISAQRARVRAVWSFFAGHSVGSQGSKAL